MSAGGTHAPDVISPSSLPARSYAPLNARLSRSCSCANSRNGSLQRTNVMTTSYLPLLGLRKFRVDDLCILHIRSVRVRRLRALRALRAFVELLGDGM